MGLLDDAIRDHLELKRLRGADPGLIAREQKEALDPVLADGGGAPDDDLSTALEDLDREAVRDSAPVRETAPVRATPVADIDASSPSVAPPDVSNVVQETAELDMRTVMHEHPEGAAEPVGGARPIEDRDEDSLEWEVPEKVSSETSVEAGQQVPYTQGPSGP
jgi:hypothetical protein